MILISTNCRDGYTLPILCKLGNYTIGGALSVRFCRCIDATQCAVHVI